MSAPTVKIRDSVLTGTASQGVKRFLNVPYALPPTGAYRFLKPRPLPQDYHYGELDCATFGNICPQPLYYAGGQPVGHPPAGSKMSEDCLKLNIWMPDRTPPDGGWPCLVFIHGGWLQIGSPLHDPANDPTELLSGDGYSLDAIVIGIGYRLNVFGFLASSQHAGNAGLFDQRCALEYIANNIHFFNGNKDRVTLSGLSAGANSVQNQLHYACRQRPDERPLFRRLVMYSNALSAQPKQPAEVDVQVDELCDAFDIKDTELEARLAALRAIPDVDLAAKLLTLKNHTFRPVTDGEGPSCFIPADSANLAETGNLAAYIKKHDIRFLLGETENEERTYRAVNPPHARAEFLPQLENYYAPGTAEALMRHYADKMPSDDNDAEAWKDIFGEIVAAAQVRASQRHLVNALERQGVPVSSIMRYRVAFRLSQYSALGVPESMGVAHGMCQALWWFAKRLGYTAEEEAVVRRWLAPWRAFVCQDAEQEYETTWGCETVRQYRLLGPDGTISTQEDSDWERLLAVGRILMPAASV